MMPDPTHEWCIDHPCKRTSQVEEVELSMTAEVQSARSQACDPDILALDLTLVKRKLEGQEEGQGWTAATCDAVEAEYKRFLSLKRLYPSRDIVPNRMVDRFWHQHILNTEQYAKDCQDLFGYFVHHYPYFGMKGEADRQDLLAAFESTSRLYKQHFGDDYAEGAAKCRTQCKPQKCK
jgi:hypothetical protein